MLGTRDRCCFSIAPCVPLEGWQLPMSTWLSHLCSSAPSNQSARLQTAACRRKVFPWCTNELQVPTLYICPVENVLGRVPLIPCYLDGNTMNSIQHKYRSQIPREAGSDSRPDCGTGSRIFEVNIWRHGRTFPREISVEQAVELRKKRLKDSKARGAETMLRLVKLMLIARAE
jgi:hypothetical protein